ncbi:MAG: DNA adenine methylase [Candidatus Poribacteria bacterium]|nr:DNA adenine methylase [Candidatus Poribacteria bacterium]
MPHQPQMFTKDAFRSSDNRGFDETLPEGKALPFVKWAGGKRSITDKISERLPDNIETYHEPFVGGGAVFFAFQHMIKNATLADLNEELILAYDIVANDTENLIQVLLTHESKHSKEDGYYLKIRDGEEPENAVDRVSRFLYLNKTCYNGLYRVNKSGKFNVPEGKYVNPKICDKVNLRNVSDVLRKAEIEVGQFDKTISPEKNDFVYCDPPYDGTFSGYQSDGFGDADQKRLKETVDAWTEQGVLVMISNSDTELIRGLYKDNYYHVHSITAQRNISSNGKTRGQIPEVLITNYE